MPEYPDPYEEAAKSMSPRDLGLASKSSRLSTVKRAQVHWLWPGRLPAGKLVLLDGDPDVGKSTLTLELAARLTTGSPLADGYQPAEPVNVLFFGCEDGIADTVLPRLLAAGGDPDRFFYNEGVPEVDDTGRLGYRPAELPTDIYWIEDDVAHNEFGLIIIDPLVAFFADWVNAHRDQQVRRALMPIAQLADRTGVCVLAIRHLNKSVGAPSLYRGGGSIGILAAARTVLVAGHDPDNEGRRLLAVYKSNLAPKPPTLAYRLVPDELYDVGRIAWQGVSDKTGADILHLSEVDADERSALEEAVGFLFAVLENGPTLAKEVQDQARQVGVSERALDKAKRLVGVVIQREQGKGRGARWLWRLPDPDRLFESGDGEYGEGEPDE